MAINNLERKGFILQLIVHHERNSEVGTEAKAMERCCLLGFAPHGVPSLLSYITQNYLSGSSPAHSGLDTPE